MPVIQDEIIYRPLNKPQERVNGYQGFQPGKVETLPKGFTGKGWDGLDSKPLISNILVEHDVEIVVRDGARLYADIYRPPGSDEKVPVIIGWSPYGKKYSATDMLPVCTWKCGVIPSDLSGFEKFEGLDPAVWCPKGYAIASIDQRGAGNSDGNVQMIGSKDAEDGYDVIEWLAKREWCNGKVGMAGNSYLAISQYFIAALQPPSLAAIAPWDGLSDLYREQFVRGGIFNLSNFALIASLIIRGNGGIEDFEANYRRYPKATSEFWSDKRVDMTKINVPCYLAGSDVSSLHTMGTLRAWTEIGSKDKWLRWGGYQEWFDLYSEPHNQQELLGFFDLYLKEKKNGWAVATPRVRMTILNFGDKDPIENIVVDNWPLPQTQYTNLFIRDGGRLALTAPSARSSLSYNSEAVGAAGTRSFTYTFDKQTRIVGLPKTHLFVSCTASDDLCIYVELRKLDASGKLIKHVQVSTERRWIKKYEDIPEKDHSGVIIHSGSAGMLRASRRKIDRSRTWHPHAPFHPHDEDQKIPPGQIVELEIGIWHMGVQFEAGESLRFDVFGQSSLNPELKEGQGSRPENERNKGDHVIHFGGEYPSRVILPIVPI